MFIKPAYTYKLLPCMTLLCLATHLHGSAAVVYPSLSAQCTREDQFINAVREGNETLVQSLILQGANACHTDSNGLNAMHHAVSSGKYGLISFLKEHRVPLNSKNSAGQTPIGLAISLGSLESVQTLISCGASLDEKDSEGNTPLLFAVKLGRTEAAQLIFSKETNYDRVNNQGEHLMHLAVKFPWLVSRFLDLGISADIQDLAGRLPIHHAARVGNLDSLRLLYAKSLMRKGADKEGMTCVHTAALHGHEACVEFLLKEGGADANSVDTIRGRTPLHYAAEVGAANTLQKLLDFGANRYAQDINGATALHLAAASGSQECIKALAPRTIQSSVLRATDKQKRTALHYAVLAKQRESVQTLLAMNISKDDQDSEGQTAFQIACEQGDANIGEDLLKAKAMIASKNLKGQTPLFSAVMSGNIALVKRLVETGNNRLVQLFSREIRYIDEVHQAVVQDNVAILKVLVAAGGSLTALDQGKNTLIHTAAAHNALACLAYLFSQKCSDSEFNQEGLTPLHVALKKGHQEVIALFSKRKALTVPSLAKRSPLQYAIDQVYQAYDEQSNVHATIAQNCFIELLKAGAPLTSSNIHGNTMIHTLTLAGDIYAPLISMILEHRRSDIDINAQNHQGKTAIHIACNTKALRCLTVLLSYHASTSSRTKKGYYPLHTAAIARFQEGVALLYKYGAAGDVLEGTKKTALHLAACTGSIDTLKALLEKAHGLLEHRDQEGCTALYYAFSLGHRECVQFLIDAGARADGLDSNGQTILHKTVAQNSWHPNYTSCISLLRKAGLDINAQDSHYATALCTLALRPIASDNKDTEQWATTLMDHQCDVSLSMRDGRTAFHCSCEQGLSKMVELLLERGIPFNKRSNNSWLPLHWAASSHSPRCVEKLLKAGEKINAVTQNGWTALHIAALKGQTEVVRTLLRRGIATHLKDIQGNTALEYARLNNHLTCVQLLENVELNRQDTPPLHLAVKKGDSEKIQHLVTQLAYDINTKDNEGRSALHLASLLGKEECIYWLGRLGANLDSQDKTGKTPLHNAAGLGHHQCVRRLLEWRVKVDMQDIYGRTALHIAAQKGHIKVVQALLYHNANQYLKNNKGQTVLDCAQSNNNTECVTMCIQAPWQKALMKAVSLDDTEQITLLVTYHGAEINAHDIDGWTPLHTAVKMGHMNSVKCLIGLGAPVDIPDSRGKRTPLHWAACAGNEECIEFLISKGANANVQDVAGETPLHLMVSVYLNRCIEYLLQGGARIDMQNAAGETPLHNAISLGDTECAELLINNTADMNIQDKNGETALHRAISIDDAECVKLLISKGANVNIQDAEGETPLHKAVLINKKRFITLLLKAGAHTDVLNADEATALHMAAMHGDKETIELLVTHGATIDLRGKQRKTPLHEATLRGHVECIEYLVKMGATIRAEDDEGKTALDLARDEKHQECVALLLKETARQDALVENVHPCITTLSL